MSICKKSPSQHISRKQCLLCALFMLSLQQMLYVVPMHFNTTFNLRCTDVCTLSKVSGFARISWQIFSIPCCNTSKSLISAEYTEVFSCPHSQKCKGLRSGIMWSSWLGFHALSTLCQKSDSCTVWQCGKNEVVPIMLEPRWLSLKKGHMFQEYW
jgi:hypothetical protein